MKTEDAQQILAAARAEAEKLSAAVAIVVVDSTCAPVVLERLDGAAPMLAGIAESKAATSAFTGMDSAALEQIDHPAWPTVVIGISARLGGRFAGIQGAVVLRRGDTIAGAVGVSGATSEQDEQIAKAGAAAVGGGEKLTAL